MIDVILVLSAGAEVIPVVPAPSTMIACALRMCGGNPISIHAPSYGATCSSQMRR